MLMVSPTNPQRNAMLPISFNVFMLNLSMPCSEIIVMFIYMVLR